MERLKPSPVESSYAYHSQDTEKNNDSWRVTAQSTNTIGKTVVLLKIFNQRQGLYTKPKELTDSRNAHKRSDNLTSPNKLNYILFTKSAAHSHQ